MLNSKNYTINKVYGFIVIGFLLFLVPITLSFQTLTKTYDKFHELEDNVLLLSGISNELRSEIESYQSGILSSIVLFIYAEHPMVLPSKDGIEKSIAKIQDFIKSKKSDKLYTIFSKISNRYVGYLAVESALLESISQKRDSGIEDGVDALGGFIRVTYKFKEDIKELIELSQTEVKNSLKEVESKIKNTKAVIFFTTLFGFGFMAFSFYYLIIANKRYLEELNRAEMAEIEQKKLEEELLQHTKYLELEVEKKTKEINSKYYNHPLTKLPNRHKLFEDMKKEGYLNIALFNIDDFQSFNDNFGNEKGDLVLKYLAHNISLQMPTNLKLYHLNGDEFAVVGDTNSNSIYFLKHINSIFSNIKEFEYNDGENQLILSVTAGVCVDERENSLNKADIALKVAKKSKKDLIIYSSLLHKKDDYLSNIKWAKELSSAIKTKRIITYYQPILNTKTLEIEKYETLVRMIDSKGNTISPFYFLNIAKQTKLYPKITKAVFLQAVETIMSKSINCSINLSVEDILSEKTRDLIYSSLDKQDCAKHITFEILESEGIENFDEVYKFIQKAKHYGAKVAIDDFGTGYSNFAYLAKLDIDYLKIDASLIKHLPTDINSQAVVKAIVEFAKNMNIKTVAEFVSSKEIYDIVKSYDIDYVQGYYLGEPKPI